MRSWKLIQYLRIHEILQNLFTFVRHQLRNRDGAISIAINSALFHHTAVVVVGRCQPQI